MDKYKVKRLFSCAANVYNMQSTPTIIERENEFHPYARGCDFASLNICHKQRRVTISFRGTDGSAVAWRENFDAIDRAEYEKSKARVHEGFWEGFMCFREEFWNKIRPLSAAGYKIEFTGHSRGGAIAAITAWRLWVEEGIVSTCYIFAAPRQGGKRYAAAIEDSPIDFLRIQTKYDIVPNTPPRILGYTHADPYYILQTAPFPFGLRLLRGILQHTIRVYKRAIKRL